MCTGQVQQFFVFERAVEWFIFYLKWLIQSVHAFRYILNSVSTGLNQKCASAWRNLNTEIQETNWEFRLCFDQKQSIFLKTCSYQKRWKSRLTVVVNYSKVHCWKYHAIRLATVGLQAQRWIYEMCLPEDTSDHLWIWSLSSEPKTRTPSETQSHLTIAKCHLTIAQCHLTITHCHLIISPWTVKPPGHSEPWGVPTRLCTHRCLRTALRQQSATQWLLSC